MPLQTFTSILDCFAGSKHSRRNRSTRRDNTTSQVLEERMLLSSISVVARGTTGTETLQVQVDGNVVATHNVTTTDQAYTTNVPETVTASRVRVAFTNDGSTPADRNLIVDRIIIDGDTYETEDPAVFSTGTWTPDRGVVRGFHQTETLHVNGHFQYSSGDVVPDGSGFELETVASGLIQPVSYAVADDGRIFVAEKEGRVKVVQDGVVISTFLDINLEVQSGHDRGLLGIALHPDFASNGHMFLNFTEEIDFNNPDNASRNSDAAGRMIRITASTANPNVANLASRVDVLTGHVMTSYTHSVGDIDFDNDGNLIFTWGDGGFSNALRLAAQNPDSKQGKVFRINPEYPFHGVPENPYYQASNPGSVRSKVWALGIRNSWKISVDRATGDVYMGEVTDAGPEEINVIRGDGSTLLNFGWPYFEGDNRTGYGQVPAGFNYTLPLVQLPHLNRGGDAIMGGTVYRGNAYPSVYDGLYFFGNFNLGALYTTDQTGNFQYFGNIGDYAGSVDLQIGPDGHLWQMSLFTGKISRIVYNGEANQNFDPLAIADASVTAGEGPLTVRFDATPSFDPSGDNITFAWDFDSNGTIDSTSPTPTHTYSSAGRSVATLTVSDGRGGSDTTQLEIDVLANAPTENIALGKPAAISTTDQGGLASRAVDGNTSGNFNDGSVALSGQQRTPYWEVDLEGRYNLDSIRISPRTDGGFGDPLTDYWILVSDNPFESFNLDAIRSEPDVIAIHHPATTAATETIDLDIPGRYIRVQLASISDELALAEVEIFGTAAAPTENDTGIHLNAGVLYVVGTPGNDNIKIGEKNGNINVKAVGEKANFSTADVSKIVVLSGDGNDKIRVASFTAPADIFAGYGDDKIKAAGDVHIEGGAGYDNIKINQKSDLPINVLGGSGNDVIKVGSKFNPFINIEGGDGDDNIKSTSFGGANVDGGNGHDVIIGGKGNDTLLGGNGNDTINGGAGRDLIYGENGNDTLRTKRNHAIILGGSGNDILYTGNGRGILIGGTGADVLVGGKASDILINGTTSYDANPTVLTQVMNSWTSLADYASRVATVTSTLTNSTVTDDAYGDSLNGLKDLDLFYSGSADALDAVGEVVR